MRYYPHNTRKLVLENFMKVWLLRDFYLPEVHDPPVERLYWKMYLLSAISGSCFSVIWINCFHNESEGQMCLMSIWAWLGHLGRSLPFCSGSWRLGNTLLNILNAYLSILGLYLPLCFLRTLLAELFCGILFFSVGVSARVTVGISVVMVFFII